jgi:RNA recognition motif-containing protein
MARRDAPHDVHKMFCLKISNIGPETTAEKLSHIFSAFGYVGDCYIPMDLKSRQPRNFAFLRYKDKAHADMALFEMNGAVVDEQYAPCDAFNNLSATLNITLHIIILHSYLVRSSSKIRAKVFSSPKTQGI